MQTPMTMSEQVLERDSESVGTRTGSAKGGRTMSSTHSAINGQFKLHTAEQTAPSRRDRRMTTLVPAAMALLSILILLNEQADLALSLALTGLALLIFGMSRVRSVAADSVVLIGRGPMAAVIASSIESSTDGRRRLSILRAVTPAEAASLVRTSRCDEVIIAGPVNPIYGELVDARGSHPAIVSGAEKLEQLLGRVPIDLAAQDKWLMRLDKIRSLDPAFAHVKRTFDLAFSLALGAIILPVFPIIALAIKLDSRGPVFYSQERVGLGGKTFRIYKFRTMRQDAEANGAVWAQERDPRITRVGRMMRLTRLDELPQIWNVIRGQMSVVGPRPERPEFTETLAREIPGYELRQTVKPGLTGWAQVCYRYTSSIHDTRAKVEYDLYYVKHLSVTMDLKILLKTVKVVLGRQGQ
ncbi:MAG: sugar transferase [Thermomicrobiales bacterium]|nr:sugar transferase [Thermomicrobiales bacterium]